MPSVLVKIKALGESLSPAQRSLAEYILANGEEVPFLSVHELAAAAGVSTASVSRFARAVGCESFKDFRTQLGRESLASVESMYARIGSE